jgi:PAS domain S-box-containing protein
VATLYGSEMSESEHFVQFCETDTFLMNSVSEFIGAGLRAGDTCIVLATKPHRESLEERLKEDGLEVVVARMRGQYVPIDAAAALSKFMVDGSPDPGRFFEVVGGIIERATTSRHRVRIFGELVALLWADGNRAAAICLEEFWNDLGKTHSFSLFCTYPMHGFDGEVYEAEFTEICNQHSQVIPAESYTLLSSPDERLRAITLLQLRAHSLEAEIAERKGAEEQLRISENRYRRLFEASKDGILMVDPRTRTIIDANPFMTELLGYTRAQLLAKELWQIGLFKDRKANLEALRELQEKHVLRYETLPLQTQDEQRRYVEFVSTLYQANGHEVIQCNLHDITERKQAEAKFRWLFDSYLLGVFVSDFAGTFLDANDAFLDLLGYTREELQAGTMQRDALTPPEFFSLSHIAVKALQETGTSSTYEKEYLHKSGKRIPVLVAVTRIEQTDTCIGFVLDISERKELDRRKDEFIRMASHELKTPVTSLKGFLSLLQRRLATHGDEKELHYLARMDAQVHKLTKLINDLLDLSKMQTGQLVYREERFDLDALVQEIVENVQETTQTYHLLLEGQTQAEAFGDRDRVGQVLINLLNNAIKYSPQANRVLVRVAKDQSKVFLSVQDFGIGIAREHQQKIFERFYQVTDLEEKTYPGLGIGLYISCEIVKRHGGQIWVESQKGEGATFHFTLPLFQEGKR